MAPHAPDPSPVRDASDRDVIFHLRLALARARRQRDRLLRAVRTVRDEVTHKKGGPEKDQAVSVPYLYKTVTDVLAELEVGPNPFLATPEAPHVAVYDPARESELARDAGPARCGVATG